MGQKESEIPDYATVALVDDDESVRESLPDLLTEFGLATTAFASAEEFLANTSIDGFSCLILDVAMPGMTGIELRQRLRSLGNTVPVIFITARDDDSIRPRLLQQGAVECLYKPFSDTALLGAIKAALLR